MFSIARRQGVMVNLFAAVSPRLLQVFEVSSSLFILSAFSFLVAGVDQVEKELGRVLALLDGNTSLASVLQSSDDEKKRLERQVQIQQIPNRIKRSHVL